MAADGSRIINNLSIAPQVDAAICSGCGRCVAACPEKIITLETDRFHKIAVIQHPEGCTACGRCVHACPIAALRW